MVTVTNVNQELTLALSKLKDDRIQNLTCLCSRDVYDSYIVYLYNINPNITMPVNFMSIPINIVETENEDYIEFVNSKDFLSKSF